MSKEREAKFDAVYTQMRKLEADGKQEDAKNLLRQFLEITEVQAEKVKAIAKEPRNVTIKLMRDCWIDGDIRKAGQVVKATETEAAEFCDRKMKAYHPFYGYMPEMLITPNPLDRDTIVRAARVQEKAS